MEKTKVVFRVFKGEVTAVFPEEPAVAFQPWTCLCYSHVGQHSSCELQYLIYASKAATPEQYADLRRELESIGYVLDIKRRVSSNANAVRIARINGK
jgi:hypothetical protein